MIWIVRTMLLVALCLMAAFDINNNFAETNNQYTDGAEYTLENGEVGLANHKTVEAKYKEGDSVNYEVSKDKQGNNKFSFLTVDKPFNNYSNKKPSQGSFALSYAKDLLIADKISYDQLIPTANKFNNWLKENY